MHHSAEIAKEMSRIRNTMGGRDMVDVLVLCQVFFQTVSVKADAERAEAFLLRELKSIK